MASVPRRNREERSGAGKAGEAGSIWEGTMTENRPLCPGTLVTICMNCFMTGGPGKEHGIDKPPPTGRVQERSKVDIHVQLPPRILLAG